MAHEPTVNKDQIVDEWREGLDKVVERRSGPGEDVEVEVIRNFFSSGGADEPTSESHSHMDKLRHECKELGRMAKKALSTRSSSINETKKKNQPA
ncbi:hypothetical protein PILCRDRAFT_824657 [Piloderma croceum F 1598]|uniref:Uncharacterized protein n=1 Tax=Piloderma croceum (strain F 1598) TaxID=765440 RepID=A0A0C3FE84_PILCF|nr:hypothetical protein PILCRDRAFT_824657 [Piloderma croceum F 1598]